MSKENLKALMMIEGIAGRSLKYVKLQSPGTNARSKSGIPSRATYVGKTDDDVIR